MCTRCEIYLFTRSSLCSPVCFWYPIILLIVDLKDTTGLASIYLANSAIVFVGTAGALRSANLLIDSQLEDVAELLAIEMKEKSTLNELYDVKKKVSSDNVVCLIYVRDG